MMDNITRRKFAARLLRMSGAILPVFPLKFKDETARFVPGTAVSIGVRASWENVELRRC